MAEREAEQMQVMARRWLDVEFSLEARAALLADQVAAMHAAGETVSAAKLYRMETYQKLAVQAKSEAQRYARWASGEIARNQAEYAGLGIESASASIRAVYMDAGQVGGFFDLLPVEAVEAMIGYAGDGTPLYELLLEDYPNSVVKLTQTLIDSTAAGVNPRQTARLMMDDMSGNLNRALTVARSEQIRSFRQASRQQMKASGVVEGYIRRAARNPRTCMACIALDGTIYLIDELMHVHPNDRCFMQPIIKGLAPVQVETGLEWFMRQPVETPKDQKGKKLIIGQKEMMGPKYFKAWKSGDFQFEELADTHIDETWGPSVQVANLSDLVKKGETPEE
jgi:SPP1 gp7 family putative phage head morphogenesis protein